VSKEKNSAEKKGRMHTLYYTFDSGSFEKKVLKIIKKRFNVVIKKMYEGNGIIIDGKHFKAEALPSLSKNGQSIVHLRIHSDMPSLVIDALGKPIEIRKERPTNIEVARYILSANAKTLAELELKLERHFEFDRRTAEIYLNVIERLGGSTSVVAEIKKAAEIIKELKKS